MKEEKAEKIIELKDGDLVEIVMPIFAKTFGQGDPSTGIKVTHNKEKFELKYGSIVKVSGDESFNPANGVGDFDQKPYPIVKIDFIIGHKITYKIVNQ